VLAASEFPDNPAFVLVGYEMGVTPVSRFAVVVHQLADDLDAFASRVSSLHYNASQFAVVDTGLGIWGHINKLFAVLSPDVTDGDAVFVETAIGQWRREAFKVRVLHGEVS